MKSKLNYEEMNRKEREEERKCYEQAKKIAEALAGGNHPKDVDEYIRLHKAEVILCGGKRKYWCC